MIMESMARFAMGMMRVTSEGYHIKAETELQRYEHINLWFDAMLHNARAEFTGTGRLAMRYIVLAADDEHDLVAHTLMVMNKDAPHDAIRFCVDQFMEMEAGFALFTAAEAWVVLEEEDTLQLSDHIEPKRHPNGREVVILSYRTDVMQLKTRLVYAQITTNGGMRTLGEWTERERKNMAEA